MAGAAVKTEHFEDQYDDDAEERQSPGVQKSKGGAGKKVHIHMLYRRTQI